MDGLCKATMIRHREESEQDIAVEREMMGVCRKGRKIRIDVKV